MSRILNDEDVNKDLKIDGVKILIGEDEGFMSPVYLFKKCRESGLLQAQRDLSDRETRKEIGRWISKRKDTGSPWVYITQKEVDKLFQGEMPE